ncbi:MAG: NUDIX domain-containing protein [Bacteroidota bacterium]
MPALAEHGLGPATLYTNLDAAEQACRPGEVVLAVAPEVIRVRLGAAPPPRLKVPRVPPAAFLNLSPYLPIKPVTAAGGYVLKNGNKNGLKLLMIYRRGVWDLPKGKLDPGETVEEAALREVREEVGIDRLTIETSLGRTVHGYPEHGAYRIKTTYWFRMHTPETTFTPQAKERIEAVEYKPWLEAKSIIGYVSLRRHMEVVEEVL